MRHIKDVNGQELGLEDRIDTIIWPITSANHSNTRRNPIPASKREVAIENFSQKLDAKSYIYPIDDIGTTERFAEYVLKKIEVESQGKFVLTPANTIVGCSTPSVIEQYERKGFRILPFELEDRIRERYSAQRPWELVESIVQAGSGWRTSEDFLRKVSKATRDLYLKYDYGDLIIELFSDPLLGDDGDITATRDYNTYVRSLDEGAKRKYETIKPFMLPGRIVDIGCCTGSLIREMNLDDKMRESDFNGVEVARELFQICEERKLHKYFHNDNVFFHQRNITRGKIFPDNSINTTTTGSLTQEIESYQGMEALIGFVHKIYEQTALGGRWINVDVVGPEDRNDVSYMLLCKEDGRNHDYQRRFPKNERMQFKEYLDGLSTFARFLRFAMDFRHEEGYTLKYDLEKVQGNEYIRLRKVDACEFMGKKDYTDNWDSEMHEKFCSLSFRDWARITLDAGFCILPQSGSFQNQWIVANRFQGKVDLYKKESSSIVRIDYPPTNMLLVGEKR
ncbi:MAG: transferase [Candidatus Woesearchaeota archaeon]